MIQADARKRRWSLNRLSRFIDRLARKCAQGGALSTVRHGRPKGRPGMHASKWYRLELVGLPRHLIHQRLELVNILKTPVHAGKADVGNFVELFQFQHDEFAQAAGGDFTQAKVRQLSMRPALEVLLPP